jgi:hypothetical protein
LQNEPCGDYGYFMAKFTLLREIQEGVGVEPLVQQGFFVECMLSPIDYRQYTSCQNTFRALVKKYAEELYQQYPAEKPELKGATQLCLYEAMKMQTAYLNNVKCHLGSHLRRYINMY